MVKLRIVNDLGVNRPELNKLLDQMYYGPQVRFCVSGRTWAPQIDICETPDAYQLLVDLAGVSPELMEVVVDRRHVKIAGTRVQPGWPSEGCVLQTEICYGPFERLFRLTSPIQTAEARALYEEGILKVTLPKDFQGPTKVEVK